jgi:hypothetical protein
MSDQEIYYSPRVVDDTNTEFRYVILPRSHAPWNKKIMTEEEWRALGITMSRGWQHVGFFKGSETLIFSRPVESNSSQSASVPDEKKSRSR